MEVQLNPKLPKSYNDKILIAGPCSAENEEQMMRTAYSLSNHGCRIFRAGAWKPRTKPGAFEGNGEQALLWMQRVKKETKMLVATEVAMPRHVELALKYGIDILWIGARTASNPFAVQSIADAISGYDVPVLVKNPINPDLNLWIGAIERLYNAGITNITAVHRGFSTYDSGKYRNLPIWQIPIELRTRIPSISIICDPSHLCGNRELIYPICQMSEDIGFDGFMIESHCNPNSALTDAYQQVTPDELFFIINKIKCRNHAGIVNIEEKRSQIDCIDSEIVRLLSSRMNICREIGEIKCSSNTEVFQQERYSLIKNKWKEYSAKYEIGYDFIESILKLIHEKSICEQMKLQK